MKEANPKLDAIDHVAVPVTDIALAVAWYRENFKCSIDYQDDTWAYLKFENIRVALVTPGQHPGHLAFRKENASSWGSITAHRDGTCSTYIKDPAGNAVEIME